MWFGVWMDFWKEEGVPLCFGVDDKWPAAVAEAFRGSYKGPTKRFKHWTLGWVSQQAFASEKAVEEVGKPVEEGEVIRQGQLLSRRGKSWTLSSAEAEGGDPVLEGRDVEPVLSRRFDGKILCPILRAWRCERRPTCPSIGALEDTGPIRRCIQG